MRAWPVLFVTAMLSACIVHAQVPGPLLRDGAIEIGASYHEFDRSLEYRGDESRFEGDQWAAALRLGVTETLTASAELSGGARIYDDGGLVYLVGLSLQTRMWVHGAARATTSIGYAKALGVYRSSGGCDGQREQLDWNAQFEYAMTLSEQELTLWAGPALSHVNVQPQAPCVENPKSSTQWLGGLAGVGAVIEGHFVAGMQAMWIDSPEWSFQLAYRF